MKEKVIQRLIKDGYSRDIASAITDNFWEAAERQGYQSSSAIYNFILREWRRK